MAKTMTVGELMKQLAAFPPELPIFFYDMDKERDSNLEVLELAGPQFDPDDEGNIIPFLIYPWEMQRKAAGRKKTECRDNLSTQYDLYSITLMGLNPV